MILAKLDAYDYDIYRDKCIHIKIDNMYDPVMLDVLSEIDRADGKIFIDGKYYSYVGYSTGVYNSHLVLSIEVKENL